MEEQNETGIGEVVDINPEDIARMQEQLGNMQQSLEEQQAAQEAQLNAIRGLLQKAAKLEAEYEYHQAHIAGGYAIQEQLPVLKDLMVEIKQELAKIGFALQTRDFGEL